MEKVGKSDNGGCHRRSGIIFISAVCAHGKVKMFCHVLLDELYRFAEETRVMRQLDCLREYRHISRQREQRLLWLRENLPEAAKAVLQELEGI